MLEFSLIVSKPLPLLSEGDHVTPDTVGTTSAPRIRFLDISYSYYARPARKRTSTRGLGVWLGRSEKRACQLTGKLASR